jgi:hypothetical protein
MRIQIRIMKFSPRSSDRASSRNAGSRGYTPAKPAASAWMILPRCGRPPNDGNNASISAEITGTASRSRAQEKWMPMVSRP